MRSRHLRYLAPLGILILGMGLVAACSQGPKAIAPEEFYRGKTITWIVGSDPGSGTDLVARAIAPHLAEEIGATVKIENQGNDEGLNSVYTEAKQDGLTLGINSTGAAISNDILKAPGVLFDMGKFNSLADVSPGGSVFQIAPKLPHKTVEALRQVKGLKGGATSARGSMATSGAVAAEIMGLDAKIVTGYKAKKELTLALGRGEIDYMVSSDNSAKRDQEDGNLINLFVVGKDRASPIPDVPTLFEAGVTLPKELEAALQFVASNGYIVVLAPDVPQDRVSYLRKTFKTLNDNKKLQGDVEKVTNIWRPFKPGEQIQAEMLAIKSNQGLAGQIDTIFNKYSATQ
ncbi:MAG: hypothetical protein HYY30_13540 [Chloroflexi bacterium]|nr:hypothetical protein [Chloroflexota bacterium]